MADIRCRNCGTRVAFVEDYIRLNEIKHGIRYILWKLPGGIFKRVFNVLLLEKAGNDRGIIEVQSLFGTTVATTYCGYCRTALGWKFNMSIREGRFLMKMEELIVWDEHDLGGNEQNADQDLGTHEQNVDQDGGGNQQVPNEHDLGTNEQNDDQDGGGNQQVSKEQDLGTNEQNADQDGGGSNQQVPLEQDLGGNEQNANHHQVQDLGTNNEQNSDGGCCCCLRWLFCMEQNSDQDQDESTVDEIHSSLIAYYEL